MAERPPVRHLVPQTIGNDLGARHTLLFRLRNSPLVEIMRRLATRATLTHRQRPTHVSAARLNALERLSGAWVGINGRFTKPLVFDPQALTQAALQGGPVVTFNHFPFAYEAVSYPAVGQKLRGKKLLGVANGGLGDTFLFSQVVRSLKERFGCVIDVAHSGRLANDATFTRLFPGSQIMPIDGIPVSRLRTYDHVLPLGMFHVLNGETLDEYLLRAYDITYEARGFSEDEDGEWNVLARLRHRHEVDPTQGPVIFIQAACRPLKHYPHMEALATRLVERGHKVVLIGGSSDSAMRDKIGKLANLCGLPVWDTLLAMKHAALVITPDSAFMHAAAALSKPAIALYGPTSTFWSSAYPLTTSVYFSATCRFHPCWVPTDLTPPCGKTRHVPCLDQIPVEDIVLMAERKLRGEKMNRYVDIPRIPRLQIVSDVREMQTPARAMLR